MYIICYESIDLFSRTPEDFANRELCDSLSGKENFYNYLLETYCPTCDEYAEDTSTLCVCMELFQRINLHESS